MLLNDFIFLLLEIGVSPDTKIHLIPSHTHCIEFKLNDVSFNVNTSGDSYVLHDFESAVYKDNIEGCILDCLTILGENLVLFYSLED